MHLKLLDNTILIASPFIRKNYESTLFSVYPLTPHPPQSGEKKERT